MRFVIDVRKLNEYDAIFNNINHPMHTMCAFIDNNFQVICSSRNIAVTDSYYRPTSKHFYHHLIWTSFKSTVLYTFFTFAYLMYFLSVCTSLHFVRIKRDI